MRGFFVFHAACNNFSKTRVFSALLYTLDGHKSRGIYRRFSGSIYIRLSQLTASHHAPPNRGRIPKTTITRIGGMQTGCTNAGRFNVKDDSRFRGDGGFGGRATTYNQDEKTEVNFISVFSS